MSIQKEKERKSRSVCSFSSLFLKKMPKTNRCRHRRVVSSASSIIGSNHDADGRASNDVLLKKFTVDQDHVRVLYEHMKTGDGQKSRLRLQINKREAIGPSPAPPLTTTAQNNEHNGRRVTNVVINDDHTGLTVDMESTKSDINAFTIVITANGN